jgi:O-antigen/teichoic acid export membrane protein
MNAPDVSILRQVASRGFGWGSLANMVRSAAIAAAAVVYASLLSPQQFGVIGLMLVVLALLRVVQDLGAAAYVVYAQDESDAGTSAIFWLNGVVAAAVAAGLFLAAPAIAALFREPELEAPLTVVSLGHFILGIGVVQQAVMQKRMRFASLAKIDISAVIVAVGSGIVVTALGHGLWGFVVQTMTLSIVSSLGYWAFAGWRPTLALDSAAVGRALRYSGNLSAFRGLNYLSRNGDDILIGRFLTTADLGLYAIAYRVMILPATVIGNAVAAIILPILSSLRQNPGEVRRIFIESAQTVAMICFPIMTGLLMVADDFVAVFLGPEWADAAFLLRFFAVVGLVQSVAVLNGVIFQAMGRTDLLLKWGLFATPVFIAAVAAGLPFGIVGVTVAYYAAYLIVFAYPSFWIPFRLIGLSAPRFFAALARPFGCSLAMGVCVALVNKVVLEGQSPSVRLIVSVAVGAALYTGLSVIWNGEKLGQLARLQLLPPQ